MGWLLADRESRGAEATALPCDARSSGLEPYTINLTTIAFGKKRGYVEAPQG